MRVIDRPGGLPECPYFHLKALDFGAFSLRLHFWHGDDDHRALHDHRHWFLTFVLRGGYTDVSLNAWGKLEVEKLRRFSLRFRPAAYRHKVVEVLPGTVTLLLAGPAKHRWRFWLPDGRGVKRDKYFAEHGHHPCKEDEPPVRMRPDGSRIEAL